ncbi:tyrosine-type recombinase/integrase [Nocardia terrae]|uniref:tyrosine-type recombinase/integrase n=1 Tax=Nocardia terrae TaxID=2675851 RepID=UPI001F1DFBB9|nr:site-specific integrase [Nocardia terrae]
MARAASGPCAALLELVDQVGVTDAAAIVEAGGTGLLLDPAVLARGRSLDAAARDLDDADRLGLQLITRDDPEWPHELLACLPTGSDNPGDVETACRRGGALALRIEDLDQENSCVRLREKGETIRWQPISPSLMRALLYHITDRVPPGAKPDEQLFRYYDGRRITGRRYDYIWTRVGKHLPWVVSQGITAHWLRHTTLTWVERNFGYAVAHAFAGHTDDSTPAGATITYIRSSFEEVAQAVAALTGEPHPLLSDN